MKQIFGFGAFRSSGSRADDGDPAKENLSIHIQAAYNCNITAYRITRPKINTQENKKLGNQIDLLTIHDASTLLQNQAQIRNWQSHFQNILKSEIRPRNRPSELRCPVVKF